MVLSCWGFVKKVKAKVPKELKISVIRKKKKKKKKKLKNEKQKEKVVDDEMRRGKSEAYTEKEEGYYSK